MEAEVIDGRYRLDAPLGEGGMGAVHRAWDLNLERSVAVKLVRTTTRLGEREQRRFLREARMLAQLHHPNVVAVHDVGVSEGRPYLVMELLTGETLRERLRSGPLPVEVVLRIALVIAGALEAAHEAGILHLDVKPENIVFDATGEPKLSDFGISRALGDEFTQTQAQIMGTAAYLSPELLSDQPLDARADLYALGVVLYEMLAGQLPFSGGTAIAQATQRLVTEPAPPHAFNPAVPQGLSMLVLKALVREPEERFPSAAMLAMALEEYVSATARHTSAIPMPEDEAEEVAVATRARVMEAGDTDPASSLVPRTTRAPLMVTMFLLGSALTALILLSFLRDDLRGIPSEPGAQLTPVATGMGPSSPTVGNGGERLAAPTVAATARSAGAPKPPPPPLRP